MNNKQTRQLVSGLLKVFSIGVVVGVGVVAPNALQVIEKYLLTGDRKRTGPEYKRLLRHMKRLNLISIDHLADDSVYVSLTRKGKQRLQDVYLEDVIIKTPKKWDGLWRVVSFDIPSEKRDERNEFLIQLRRLGFIRSLQSMWVYPFPCTEEVYAISKIIGIDKMVMVLEAKTTEDQHKKLLKSFQKILP
ncbi:MAG: hypothetical protein AAB624_00480 [Patescibacteria group bacterium]